jgi:hypothetical protein
MEIVLQLRLWLHTFFFEKKKLCSFIPDQHSTDFSVILGGAE